MSCASVPPVMVAVLTSTAEPLTKMVPAVPTAVTKPLRSSSSIAVVTGSLISVATSTLPIITPSTVTLMPLTSASAEP